MPGRINGVSLAYAVTGAVIMWSGIKGETISDTFRGLLSGKAPAGGQEPITSTSGTESATGTVTGSAAYTGTDLEKLWTSNGGAKNTAAMAAAVGNAESSGNARATSANPDGGTNVGIWQLDTKGVGSGYSEAQLMDPDLNAKVTIMATRNGQDWSEWSDPVVNALPGPGHFYTPGSPVPDSILG